MIKRSGVFLSLILALVPWTAGAADSYDAGAGGRRCAYASGKVPGGTAFIDICQFAGADVSGDGTTAPTASPDPVISGIVRVQTTTGTDQRPFSMPATGPNPAYVQGFVMDPGMNTATITLTISTITVTLTLTAKTQAPEPDHYQYFYESVNEYLFGTEPGAGASVGGAASGTVYRPATVTGTIRSTSKGGGTLTQATSEMRSGGGAGGNLCVDTDWCFDGF